MEIVFDEELNKWLKDVHWEVKTQRVYLNQMRRYDFYKDFNRYISSKQLSFIETLLFIREKKINYGRFGDGEFGIMLTNSFKLAFQPQSGRLIDKMTEVLKKPIDNFLVGMPHLFDDDRYFGVYSNYLPKMIDKLENHTVFGNSHVSRPVFFELYQEDAVKAWRQLWEGLSVTFVTGEGSRFSYTPELFDNLKSYILYETRPVDAFSDYDKILADLKDDKSDLILMSLGPTATILAYDLAKEGKWAFDIGHITNSFDNKIKGTGEWPEKLAVKSKS